jgi:hypothetical protein
MTKTTHKEECKRVFKRYDQTCARCIELSRGEKAREGWGSLAKRNDEQRSLAIARHNCTASNCGPVCTAFDW